MKELYKYLAILFISASFIEEASAQLHPLGNMYYQNQYMGNPAFAGIEQGLNANVAYREQFTEIPGSPVTQSVTGDYGFDNRTAVGLNLNFSKSGLINYTRALATYAYHLPLDEDNKLHFGLSLGFMREHINSRDISGDDFDPVTNRFNDRGNQLDGDFGMAYTGKKLTLQAAIINLHNYLQTDPNFVNGVNYATFFSAVSYKIAIDPQFSAEPKVAYRGIKGFDDVIDAAINLSYQNRFSFYSIYHTTKSATFGFGLAYNDALTFTGMYTTNTSEMQGYANGDFEIGLNFKMNKKKN
jgi:type IX secretion system PorP/SprF family membrane protein